MKTFIATILCAIPCVFAHADNDFASSWTSSDSPVEYVLHVPKKDRMSSFWDPSNGPIPITPEKAIKLVFESNFIRRDKKIWKLFQVELEANSPELYSIVSTDPPLSQTALITHYIVTISHQQTGDMMGFMVLMDGRVFEPKLEKRRKPNKALQLTPSRLAFLFTTAFPFFATRYRTPTRARGS